MIVNTRSRWFWFGLAALALLGIGVIRAGLRQAATPQPGPAPVSTTGLPVRSTTPLPPMNRPTAALAGYATWKPHEQLQALVELERAPQIDPETTRFLVHIVNNRRESTNARNLAANALTAPGRWVAGLAETFLAQAQDASEDQRWRDYAYQFAATVAMRGVDTDHVVAALSQVAQGDGPFVGTALLMLQRIEDAGQCPASVELLHGAARRILHQPDVDINATASVLGVLGERSDRIAIADARRLVVHPTPLIRRAACGYLGSVGEAADVALLGVAAGDTDISVSTASTLASDRIRARTAPKKQ